jgi:predicted ATP-dependent protease
VRADFAPDMAWTDENIANYAAFVSRQVHDNDLLHFDRAAVARVAEHGARVRDHQRRLSARLVDIANVVIEASYWAGKNGHELVRAGDVDQAVAQRDYRANLVEERYHSLISEGTLVIDTSGARVGQVNGLSIADLGDYTFGVPARITARTSFGRGTIQSIEREIELSGPIHTKGFLILTGYLQAQYAQEWPLALGATITFEQSYDEVEGDSASSTELYALLSALADLPLRQDIAVTGAVNQHGEVRAVGGVTRKIEGFFAVCRERGLTGSQGVIIPAANAQHLMLADDIIDAVRAGDFHIWAVNHIDEGIELLTGTPAGARGAKGRFPRGSVHAKVESRLRRYAEQSKAFAVTQGERDAADGQHRRRAPATTGDRD